MTNPTSSGFVVTDNEAIHGVGATADEAWANMVANLSPGTAILADDDDSSDQVGSWVRASNFTIRSASPALIADVNARGGAIEWRLIGGIACMPDEAAI